MTVSDNGEHANVRQARNGPGPAADVAALPSRSLSWQVDVDLYRTLMSSFPTGVAVVTSNGEGASPRGATCSSLCSVTLRPPTLLVCLKEHSSTLEAIRSTGCFAVNLLHTRAREAAIVFSTPVDDRFARVRWRRVGAMGLPWLAQDAFAVAECRTMGVLSFEDTAIVLGGVLDVQFSDDVPLLYGRRQYAAWAPGR